MSRPAFAHGKWKGEKRTGPRHRGREIPVMPLRVGFRQKARGPVYPFHIYGRREYGVSLRDDAGAGRGEKPCRPRLARPARFSKREYKRGEGNRLRGGAEGRNPHRRNDAGSRGKSRRPHISCRSIGWRECPFHRRAGEGIRTGWRTRAGWRRKRYAVRRSRKARQPQPSMAAAAGAGVMACRSSDVVERSILRLLTL